MKTTEKEKIESLHAQWIKDEITDPASVSKYLTEDCRVHLSSDYTLKGKTEFLEWLDSLDQANSIKQIDITNREIRITKDSATLTAVFHTTYYDTSEVRGKHYWSLDKVSGEWKVAGIRWELDS